MDVAIVTVPGETTGPCPALVEVVTLRLSKGALMSRLSSLFKVGVIGAVALCASAALASSPWDGTWKLNPAKSKLNGYTYSYKALPGGKLQYSNGAQVAGSFGCDGKPYPIAATRTIVCTRPAPRQYRYTYLNGGKAVASSVITLSSDGKSLHEADTSVSPDGKPSTDLRTSTRLAGGPGLAGTWKLVDTRTGTPDIFTCRTFKGGIDFAYYKRTIHLTLDGKPSILHGPMLAPGTIVIATSAGPRSYMETDKIGSNPYSYSKNTVSADGKTMTTVIWDPGKQNEASPYVYEKQ